MHHAHADSADHASEGNEVVPRPTRRGRYMPRYISRRLHPLHASQDARRPQGRVAAEASNEQNNKSRPRGEFRKNNIEVFIFIFIFIYIYIYIYIILLNSVKFILKFIPNSQKVRANPRKMEIVKKRSKQSSRGESSRPSAVLSGPEGPEPALGRLSMNTTTGILGQMRLLWAFGRA